MKLRFATQLTLATSSLVGLTLLTSVFLIISTGVNAFDRQREQMSVLLTELAAQNIEQRREQKDHILNSIVQDGTLQERITADVMESISTDAPIPEEDVTLAVSRALDAAVRDRGRLGRKGKRLTDTLLEMAQILNAKQIVLFGPEGIQAQTGEKDQEDAEILALWNTFRESSRESYTLDRDDETSGIVGIKNTEGVTTHGLLIQMPSFHSSEFVRNRVFFLLLLALVMILCGTVLSMCVVSAATGALPGFRSECGQLHPLSCSALRAGV